MGRDIGIDTDIDKASNIDRDNNRDSRDRDGPRRIDKDRDGGRSVSGGGGVGAGPKRDNKDRSTPPLKKFEEKPAPVI